MSNMVCCAVAVAVTCYCYEYASHYTGAHMLQAGIIIKTAIENEFYLYEEFFYYSKKN